MSQSFFDAPILNSPYRVSEQNWELDSDGRPTDRIIERRRKSDLISAMPGGRPRAASRRA